MTVEEYLGTSFEDGDREYLDGHILARNVGDYFHSLLQALLIGHLAGFQRALRIQVLPACRTRVSETRYRVPDLSAMLRPYRHDGRVVLDPPFLVIEVLSPEDSFQRIWRLFADYEAFGTPHLVLLDPEHRKAYAPIPTAICSSACSPDSRSPAAEICRSPLRTCSINSFASP